MAEVWTNIFGNDEIANEDEHDDTTCYQAVSPPFTLQKTTSEEPSDTYSPSSEVFSKRKKTKKRLQHKNEWLDMKRKCLTNLGKSYVSKRGKLVDSKVMGKPCNCKNKCGTKMTEEQRLECFVKFWKLGSKEKQWQFVIEFVKKTVKKRRLNRNVPNKRQYTFKYFLPLISSNANIEADNIKICKTMFLNTLAVSERIIRTAFHKYNRSTGIEQDNRGKHSNHRSVINDEMIKSVCDHVTSFAPVESYFIRKDSTKLYLDGSLSISRMYKLYNEWFDAADKVYSSKVQTERQYRDIVNKNFNIGFHIPKKRPI
ncbi:uncharacterized protein [Maniola hyperantus]|uniref:uncharacterized protein n=1 Tax=Aphantopus hyperantus TaxID=2795564 RepID=UPI0037498303